MKLIHYLLLFAVQLIATPSESKAQFGIGGPLPVIDHVHIGLNASHNALDLVEQITQVLKLIEQIRQMVDYLERFGDPKLILDVAGAEELLAALNQSGLIESSPIIVGDANGIDVFDYGGLGVYKPVGPLVTVDGVVAEPRDPSLYRPEDAAQKTFENYRVVQASVFSRREDLKRTVASTTAGLQAATTASEVQKLHGVLIGLQTELAAVDQELEFAALENLARHLENENQRRVNAKASIERDAAVLRTGSAKDQQFYPLYAEPVFFTQEAE